MKKFILQVISIIVISIGLVLMVKAWTEPSQAPPAANVPAPLNVGIASQTKTGNLTLVNGLIVSGGNVGIGTAGPDARLRISGGDIKLSNNRGLLAAPSNGDQYTASLLRFDSQNAIQIGDGWTNFTSFTTAGSERVRIVNNGNVGIGKTNPGQKLDVAGNIATDNDIWVGAIGQWLSSALAAGGGGAPNQDIYPTTLSCGFWCASNWCKNQTYNGKTDWRLPTLEELLSWTNSLPWANSEWLWTTTIAPPGDWVSGGYPIYPNEFQVYVARVGGWPVGLATYYVTPDTGAGRIACVRP